MSKCTNPEIGAFLHAYELGALPEEDLERFEVHLLSCDYCFRQIKDFERSAALLRTDKEVKHVVRAVVQEQPPFSKPSFKKLLSYLWPKAPLIFKPALIYILLILMIYPTYKGLLYVFNDEDEIRPLQAVSLFATRGEDIGELNISRDCDGLVYFRLEGAVVGEAYHVIIESEDGTEILCDDTFSSFDGNGIGWLHFPRSKMKPGRYRLIITKPGTSFSKTYPLFQIEK